ncbi:4-(cytidine 5'-diphospho)-2-C-methyl-D-erythritol kinase [Psychrobacter frigidicola]|uniref:4-(cytidine 5'-diphospho)-2-C-methyl-D-erythritol kinase n=1 Tax=Psychrobacter frigidicola TaxID=45611 RepID=UPI00191875B2|nr:4-(cytidine 5'-diphospho)-2-C-methyl-D-erythritol kinase [Psychrobacter frigidicola]
MTENTTILHFPITRLSPAKINLFLHITGKRADGYHNLQTVFRLLDWGDYLHFLPTAWINLKNLSILNTSLEQQAATLSNTLADKLCAQLVTLTGANNITDNIDDNLIIKATRALLTYVIQQRKLPTRLQQVTITLDKQLPMGAGLGGGSSNAATTLLVLNELWQFDFSNEQLRALGATLGADVPIFIFGRDAIAMGIGEQLTPIELPDQHYLLLTPSAHINTAQLFAHPLLSRDIRPLSATIINEQSAHYNQMLSAPYHNVFTPIAENLAPAVTQALQYLRELEPQALAVARMTGSGSAVFLPLNAGTSNKRTADNRELLIEWVKNAPCPAYIVNNLRLSM